MGIDIARNDQFLPGPAGLAGIHGIGTGVLRAHARLSEGRDVWPVLSDQAFGVFDSGNIAEGYGQENTRAFIRHLRIAQGSLKELETHLLLAERVGVTAIGTTEGPMAKCESVGKMLRLFIRSLQKKLAEP
jgi:hypothetical protein